MVNYETIADEYDVPPAATVGVIEDRSPIQTRKFDFFE